MKRWLGILVMFASFVVPTLSRPVLQLEERHFLSNKLVLLMPREFELMGEEMLKLKYPTERRPTLVYTNKEGTVNVALNHTQDRVTLSQLPDLYKTVEAHLQEYLSLRDVVSKRANGD